MSRTPSPTPASTYRLQVTSEFTLFDAARTVPYLADLGVDWVYLSPILESDSEHGYDTVDFATVSAARGGRAGLEAVSQAAHARGMGVLVDIVPNHMGVGNPARNSYWWDVLKNGQDSQHAPLFDIDWAAGQGKVILPELGAARDLAELRIGELDGEPVFELYEQQWPVDPSSWPGDGDGEGTTAARIGGENTNLPSPQDLLAVQNYSLVPWQAEDFDLNYRRFFTIRSLAGVRVEDPQVFERTHQEIASWFADGLVDGLRIDHIDGLADPQEYLERLEALTGGAYVVVEKILETDPRGENEELPDDWKTAGTTGYEIIAAIEGALTHYDGFFQLEALRQHLASGGELTDPADLRLAAQGKELRRHPTVVSGILTQLENEAKSFFASGALGSEMQRLARELRAAWAHLPADVQAAIGEDPSASKDVDQLAEVFAVLCSALPEYRVYRPTPSDHAYFARDFALTPDSDDEPLSAAGRLIKHAISRVRSTARSAVASPGLLAYIGLLLTTDDHPLATRFAQTTGAVMAKGVEDTAFYRYATLTALNEVGGSPANPHSPSAMLAELRRRAQRSVHALSSLTTHDTKRGEDTRARILTLAEVPQDFADFLATVRREVPLAFESEAPELTVGGRALGVNASVQAGRTPTVDRSFEILAWQAVLGAWPVSPERIEAYLVKAAREAGEQTRWTQPNEAFEASLAALAQATQHNDAVRGGIQALDARIRQAGWSNGLVAKAVQLLAPGVPDVYNGAELFEQSLVDPDNRRAVDYGLRRELLSQLPGADGDAAVPPPEFWRDETAWTEGSVKLQVTRALLQFRRSHRELFDSAAVALRVTGPASKHAMAFMRVGQRELAVIGTRMPLTLEQVGGWGDTVVELPAGTWRDVLTGARFTGPGARLDAALSALPVAVLLRLDEDGR